MNPRVLMAVMSMGVSAVVALFLISKGGRRNTQKSKQMSPGGGVGGNVGGGGVGGGNNSCARYCGPKYFVGGAFAALIQDMKGRKMPAGVGYHLHPMGYGIAKNGGFATQMLSQFSTKQYFYEADLDAWTDGSNPLQTNNPGIWGSWLNAAAPGWKCALFAPWAKSADIAAVEPAIRKYKQVFDKVRGWGCKQCWIFWSPPSEPSYNRDVLTKQAWAKIAKATGATGICVDHPAQRSDWLDVSFAALKWAKANGLGTGWVFNGTGSTAQVAAMLQKIKTNVGSLSFVSSDNFSSQGSGWAAASAELNAMLKNG